MKNSKWTFFIITLLMLTSIACQDTLPQRSTINPSQTTDGGDDDDTEEPVEITRPTNDIKWKDDYCICRDGKPVSYNNCGSFCSGKNTNAQDILYATFSIGTKVQLGGFGSVHGWCTAPLATDQANAKCIIKAKDSSGNVTEIDTAIPSKSNSLTANVSGMLVDNKTYVLTLVEATSGAQSDSVQIVKFSEDVQTPILGPLKLNPITQYACLIREYSQDSNTGDIYFENAYRMHFYFQPRTPPTPVTAGVINLICHDIFNPLYGKVDNELYPRFEEAPKTYTLWDSTDPRFYDNDGNGIAEINDIIRQKTIHNGGSIPSGTVFFNQFQWAGAPQLTDTAGNSSAMANLGYYMAPWIDQTTYRSYCLKDTHYNSSNPLFRALGDVIQVDTEGLYIGVKSGEAFTDSTGTTTTAPDDYILIRETDLKDVWFYKESNGTLKTPTDANVANVAVYFYYPFNKSAPHIKGPNQKIYRVRGANELNQDSISRDTTSNTGNSSSQYPPHDRRIGCIPKQ